MLVRIADGKCLLFKTPKCKIFLMEMTNKKKRAVCRYLLRKKPFWYGAKFKTMANLWYELRFYIYIQYYKMDERD